MWKDNKDGAFTLRFDDSMLSHDDHTFPALISRGLVASFFINPATDRYGYGIDTWESLASRSGMEICPHTMNHTGAADFEEADYEIGESFRIVWKLNPPDKSRLYPFSRGGGTTWPSGYRETVEKKYPIAPYRSVAISYDGGDTARELIAFAKKAMEDNAWHTILTHGTGPNLEWLGFEVSNFEALLDYLVSVKEKLWIGTAGDIYKYVIERNFAKVGIIEETTSHIRIHLSTGVDVSLFDYPLTLITEVPESWNFCHVSQGEFQGIYPVQSGKVMYEAFPGKGEIKLTGSTMDTSAPGKIEVRDGTADDIDISINTHSLSANWDAAEDAESGIRRYWYKIGTTPGGAEVLDWIDNGMVRSFITSRTDFSLIRGERYYVSVKAVNGVGLISESISDGFEVELTPDHISFRENFDNGYLSQWNEKHTRIGSQKNIIYISGEAAYSGSYGIQCHLQEGENNSPYLAKHDITDFEDIFTRVYFQVSSDFTLSEESGSIQIMELRDESGEYVAGVYIGYNASKGLYIYGACLDNTGYRTSLPGIRSDYPLSYVPIEKEKWLRVDIRTIAHKGKGGAEFWLNGMRKGCITNRYTDGKKVNSLYIGAINVPDASVAGDIYFDDITISDSFLK
jgi:hypothetical protein